MGRKGCVLSSGSNIPPQTSDQVMAILPSGCYDFLLNSQSGHRSWSFEKNGPCCVSVTQRAKNGPRCVSVTQRTGMVPTVCQSHKGLKMAPTVCQLHKGPKMIPTVCQSHKGQGWSSLYVGHAKGSFTSTSEPGRKMARKLW